MTIGKAPRLTWSRLGIALSIGLVVFGVIDASLPHSHPPQSLSVPRRRGTQPERSRGHSRSKSGTACHRDQCRRNQDRRSGPIGGGAIRRGHGHHRSDTTPRATQPSEPLLAPGLTVPRQLAWPEAWVAEDRRTTVVLDPPGPAVAVGAGQVAVVVTGRMVVTTDAGPSTEVPVDERVTLRLIAALITQRLIGTTRSAPRWVVTNVGTGS